MPTVEDVPTVENDHQIEEMKFALANIVGILADNDVPIFTMVLERNGNVKICGNISPQTVSKVLKIIGV